MPPSRISTVPSRSRFTHACAIVPSGISPGGSLMMASSSFSRSSQLQYYPSPSLSYGNIHSCPLLPCWNPHQPIGPTYSIPHVSMFFHYYYHPMSPSQCFPARRTWRRLHWVISPQLPPNDIRFYLYSTPPPPVQKGKIERNHSCPQPCPSPL